MRTWRITTPLKYSTEHIKLHLRIKHPHDMQELF